ncbi:MAG: SurA N-terminal domain-containing protein [Dysgonamonadaceae bacterium]|jgi:peptidyl-prolyl cis-trans isomerase D|nr:SurA N-terminal domain-containing protein [Dysgonamonadaceae bacterium]
MATLEKIRSKAGLLVAVVGIALLAFVIGDFLKSGSTFFHQSKEKIATVNGTSISIQEYQAKVEEMTEVYKRRMQSNSINEDMQTRIREDVFESLVNNILLGDETEKIGMTVGKDELSDMIIGDNISPLILQMPDFQNPQTGTFDKNMLLQFLQTIESGDLSNYPEEMKAQLQEAKKYWLFWEQTIKQQKLQSKYSALLGSAIAVNSIEAKNAYEEKKISVGFDYVTQNYQSIPDDQVSVSDSEIKQLYEKRKNTYKQEKQQVISFIAVDVVPSNEDEAAIRKTLTDLKPSFSQPDIDISALVNENSDLKYIDAFMAKSELRNDMQDFVEKANVNDVEGPELKEGSYYAMYKLVAVTTAPDSVKINQLVLPNMEDQDLKNLSDSIIGVIKGGKSFADVATEMTQGRTNGEMGYMTEAQLLAATDVKFKDQIFNGTIGDIFVAKSIHGSHLVQIVEKTKPVAKYKVATIQSAVTPSTETYSKLYNDLNSYIAKNNTLEKFKTAAAESGYMIQNEMPITENQPNLINISSSRPAIRWAFEHRKGDISEIFECQDHFIVVAVDGSLKAGYRPLSSVSEILKRELLNDKKAEKIINDLKAKNYTSLDEYAKEMNATPNSVEFVTFSTSNISGIGTEPIINARAPLTEVGQIAGPLKGRAGIYVLNITSKKVSEVPYNEESEKQSLQSTNMYRMYSFMPALRDKSKIEDNRIRFY